MSSVESLYHAHTDSDFATHLQSQTYIVVGGAHSSASGEYILTLDEEDCGLQATNTNCSTAEPLSSLSATIYADFSGLGSHNNDIRMGACYMYSGWKRLWYCKWLAFLLI